jgi:hypothetical protein
MLEEGLRLIGAGVNRALALPVFYILCFPARQNPRPVPHNMH